jgi:thymidylate synthase
VFFSLRDGMVNAHVFMRSSDIWLGLPYDIFNFSMLVHHVCQTLNRKTNWGLSPGLVHLTAANSHLYARDHETAKICLAHGASRILQPATPAALFRVDGDLLGCLHQLREGRGRWWVQE